MSERGSHIAAMDAAASTDLLHRRAVLPYCLRFVLRGSSVCVKTDSPLMSEALRGLNLLSDLSGRAADAEWEIAVEASGKGEAAVRHGAGTEPIEIYRFGPSRALRMSSGSWFAHTPPSLSGVGFAMVAGNECDQIHQLCVYLSAIRNLVEDFAATSISDLRPEVAA